MAINTWGILHRTLLGFFHGNATRRSKRPHRRGSRTLHGELLEPRYLLSSTPITLDATKATVVIQGTADADHVIVWNDSSNQLHVSLQTLSENYTAVFASSSVTLVQFSAGNGDDIFQNMTSIRSLVWGGAGNDTLIGGSGNDRLYGGADNDILYGGEGDDELRGEDGIDSLFGDAGNDLLLGGTGNDRLFGGADNDLLYGNDGDDELRGEDGNDSLFGDAGNDLLLGGSGNDRLFGGADNDLLYGDEGNDELRGQEGDDLLFGGDHADLLLGGEGHDTLVGNADNDTLDGGNGNDVLIGSEGVDTLNGSAGEDVLIGGIVNHDVDNLRLLGQTWASNLPYSQRIESIESESFAARLFSEDTVFEDGVADNLSGGDGLDWFFQTGALVSYVPEDVQPNTDHNDHDSHHDHHDSTVIVHHPPRFEGFELISAIDVLRDRQSAESLHTRLPHVDNPVLQREHLTLFQLVRYDQITHYAVRSGDWSSSSTWSGGVVPGNGARVLIPLGVEVQVDQLIKSRLTSVRIDGKLTFSQVKNTELRADTVVVAGTGAFEMGTSAAPIVPQVRARLLITNDGPIDRTVDPFALGRGLISHGRVSIHGAEVTPFVELAGPVQAGSYSLLLKEVPVGWKPGDTIVIASSSPGTQQNEVRQILFTAGNWVILFQPLTYNHVAPASDLSIHVANVSRNAVIESESSAIDRRGHVMFMHNRDVDIAYAGFYRLGRTDKLQPLNDPAVNSNWILEQGTGTNPRGRYPVHFHRNGQVNDGNPSLIHGSAVVDAPGWGFVNHSSYVDMWKNVAFDVKGAAFATEVGDEIGSFRGNIAIGTSGSGERVEARVNVQDFGHRGDGFWFQGVGVRVSDNIAAGNAGSAFLFYARALVENGVRKEFLAANLPDPALAGGAPTIDVGKMPIIEFENNVGYASTSGLSAWYLMEKAIPAFFNVLQNGTFWNNIVGVEIPYTRHTALRNLRVIYANVDYVPQFGVRGNAVTTNILYEKLTITGYTTGIAIPLYGNSMISGGTFRNQRDILIQTGFNRSLLIYGLKETPNIVMSARFSLVGDDATRLFTNDIVTLNFGSFNNRRLYYEAQLPEVVPFPQPYPGLPAEYVGLTNQQLWDTYGIAIGGAIAPSNSIRVPNITGVIGPA